MSFAGFSEADLISRSIKKPTTSTPRRVKLPVMKPSGAAQPPNPPLPAAARLAPSPPPPLGVAPNATHGTLNPDLLSHVAADEENSSEPLNSAIPAPEAGLVSSQGTKEEVEGRSKIEIMQARQKQMEEENMKKKHILSQAIAERKQRTCEETEKLQRAQAELGQIDKCLSADVRLIRDEIETASLEFMESQKRYDRAEKEFVSAKLRLHQTSERKEQLTEHLITVIQQSELRKGQKLEEIMRVLDIRTT
ncbi:RAB6-interacting golgin-like isoform X2 [Tigriopus californicus]|uniref:RAB6-interacting golgin-like isoform X2 n=1 Tax=Tigriopus californicus TaxID=6832 RepID=UPI0027DA83B4|nr:RAB6-interacting golgin-like isoform X2 [Tigriopus californicus]